MTVAAHPDDEVLGCGATVRKWVSNGAEAYALILAEGITSRISVAQDEASDKLDALRKDALSAAKITGYRDIFFEQLPDNRMDSVDLLDVTQKIEAYIQKVEPTVIFTHHCDDLNIDHRITYEAVITACRPLAGSCIEKIYSFQIPSSTEWHFPYRKNSFAPNSFVDITDTIDIKVAAMKCYESEIREAPHPRSAEIIKAIAKQWGSVVNADYAEAFELIYDIIS